MSLADRYFEVVPKNGEFIVNMLYPNKKPGVYVGSKEDAIQFVKDRGKFMSQSESSIGRHNDISDSEFDPYQLKIGTEEELEHTDDIEIAKNIAKDHLYSDPDYYRKLKKFVENTAINQYTISDRVRAGNMVS